MPSFLDFIFPFGDQLQKQDYHFAGLRYEDSLGKPHIKHQVAGAGRFEVCLQLAYSLKSVERSRWQPGWPWVVRQTSIYNSFELEKGKSAWIIVKANTEVRDRFAEKLKHQSMPAGLDRAFVLMLESHLIPCQWSNEPWRWHINFLESRLQALTGTSLTADVHSHVEQEPHRVLQQRNTGRSGISNTATSDIDSKSSFSRKFSRVLSWSTNASIKDDAQPMELEKTHEPPPPPYDNRDSFKLQHLQDIQFIEEKANEIRLVLVTNAGVISALRDHLDNVWNNDDLPVEIQTGCKTAFADFNSQLNSILHDTSMYIQSVDAIIHLLLQKKNLVSEYTWLSAETRY